QLSEIRSLAADRRGLRPVDLRKLHHPAHRNLLVADSQVGPPSMEQISGRHEGQRSCVDWRWRGSAAATPSIDHLPAALGHRDDNGVMRDALVLTRHLVAPLTRT